MYKEDVKLAARELYGVRNELSVVDRLLLRGDCIIIPYKMRKEILNRIHDGYPGISKSRERAKQAVWWPGISKDIQQMHGIPETVISDNGRQFTSQEFKTCATAWNFHHITSSPHYLQANGEAERAVQTAKKILQQTDQHLALLTYRATPIPSLGKSPAELAFGCRLRTRLPMIPKLLSPNGVNHKQLKYKDERAKVSQKRYFDQHSHPQPSLHPGDPVLIKLDGEKGWKQPR
ncbi:Pol polyprotein [Plakobranchus ocellatus]|uniref:Pol polyprotein n=1 Tax=Plakobranchus ocellatus TaxID=259542 RepID=A0AAV3ZMA9_9GAST|nr:Pol polyprotein [Plakobranchus ocellatus]